EIDIQVFGLERPRVPERRLDAGPDRPAELVIAEARRAAVRSEEHARRRPERQRLIDLPPGGAAGRVPERAARRQPADAAARRSEPFQRLLVRDREQGGWSAR